MKLKKFDLEHKLTDYWFRQACYYKTRTIYIRTSNNTLGLGIICYDMSINFCLVI